MTHVDRENSIADLAVKHPCAVRLNYRQDPADWHADPQWESNLTK